MRFAARVALLRTCLVPAHSLHIRPQQASARPAGAVMPGRWLIREILFENNGLLETRFSPQSAQQ